MDDLLEQWHQQSSLGHRTDFLPPVHQPIEDNDIPDLLEKWHNRDPEQESDRKAQAFFVPKKEIKENGYDLSINRYKEIEYEEVEYDPPKVILGKLRSLENEIRADLDALEGMLG